MSATYSLQNWVQWEGTAKLGNQGAYSLQNWVQCEGTAKLGNQGAVCRQPTDFGIRELYVGNLQPTKLGAV